MEMSEVRIPVTGVRMVTLLITERDLVRSKFRPFDLVVIDDCAQPDRTIADRLLALELIARRIEEAS